MDVKQLKEDVRQGRVDADRLVDLLVGLQRQLESAQRQLESASQELHAAKQRIDELEKQLGGGAPAPTTQVDEPFSLRAEEKRQQKKKKKRKGSKKGRRGRLRTADKVKLAERTEPVFPGAGRLRHLPRPAQSIWYDPRRARPQ
jgi:exonuclease VII large subunit